MVEDDEIKYEYTAKNYLSGHIIEGDMVAMGIVDLEFTLATCGYSLLSCKEVNND